jgi:hypothetical protein
MKRKLALSLLSVITASFSVCSIANTLANPHSFGGHIAAGELEFRDSKASDNSVAQVYAFYNYALTEQFSLEAGLNIGLDIDNWDCYEDTYDDWHCTTRNNKSMFGLGVDEVEYSNIVAAVKGIVPLSKRNSLYAKLGANYYDYELSRNHRTLYSDTGLGLYVAAGWQYEWDSGIGMNVGLEKYQMGSLDSLTSNIGISYRF